MALARSEGVFRDPSAALATRLVTLRRQRRAELARLEPTLERVYAARLARTAGGVVATFGMAAVFVAGLVVLFAHGLPGLPGGVRDLVGGALLGVWGATCVVTVGVRLAARRSLRRHLARALEPSGDSHRDFDFLEHVDVPAMAAAALSRREASSMAWSLAGAAMTLPLFLHFAIFSVATSFAESPLGFGDWVALSALLVAHCHIVLARRCYVYGHEIASGIPRDERDDAGVGAVSVAMAVSLVPGLALLGIPTVVVGLTGSVLVPALFWDARALIARERRLLAAVADR